MKHIIAFAGSNSTTSINKQLATYVSQLVKDVKVTVLDLNDFEMPIYSPEREKKSGYPKQAIDFVNHLRNADGIIISLAEHNAAYSAAFKNIFDWGSRVEQKLFLGKPMLLMATSDGQRGGQSVLQIALDRFPRHNANIVGEFSLPSFSDNFSDGKITNEELNKALLKEVEQFKNSLSIMELKHEESKAKNRFFLEDEGKVVGEMTYIYTKDEIIDLNHTEIDSAYRGQSLGQKLMDAAVDFMRSNNLKATASCSYANKMLGKTDTYKDVRL